MNAKELFHADGTSAGIWYCQECRRVAGEGPMAAQCCRPVICACGATCERPWTACSSCRDKLAEERRQAAWDKAEKRNGWEWTGPVVTDDAEGYSDGFWRDLEELQEWLEDEEMTLADVRVYATRKVEPIWDAASMLEDLCSEMYEDAAQDVDDAAVAELQAYLDNWLAEHRPTSYEGDMKVALVFPEDE